jgi:hypothetical protein
MLQRSLAALLLAAASIAASSASASACHADGEEITVRGTAFPQPLQMADGSFQKVWVLELTAPFCVIGSDENGLPVEEHVSRMQVVGTPPPNAVLIELKGKLSSDNVTQYYAEPTAIVVKSGRKISGVALDKPTNSKVSSVVARGLGVVPGALICPDYNTLTTVFDLYNAHWEETYQDVFTNGQSRLLRGAPAQFPDLAYFACTLVIPGTPLFLEIGNVVPVVSVSLADGTKFRGVTLPGMIGRN